MPSTQPAVTRPPLWNKSMARYLGSSALLAVPADTTPLALPLDEPILKRMGLKLPPSDPRLLAEFLQAEDRADAAADADGFSRGIRRALRIHLALAAKLHERDRQPWKVWVEARFQVGYACFNRYHVAAELQVGLLSRGLPLLVNEHQSRVLAPFRRHERFWRVLADAASKTGLPPAAELKQRLPVLLGVTRVQTAATPRIRLHRILGKLVHGTPAGDDPAVAQALGLLRQAIVVLEKGAA
jgi:hypothetical protein